MHRHFDPTIRTRPSHNEVEQILSILPGKSTSAEDDKLRRTVTEGKMSLDEAITKSPTRMANAIQRIVKDGFGEYQDKINAGAEALVKNPSLITPGVRTVIEGLGIGRSTIDKGNRKSTDSIELLANRMRRIQQGLTAYEGNIDDIQEVFKYNPGLHDRLEILNFQGGKSRRGG